MSWDYDEADARELKAAKALHRGIVTGAVRGIEGARAARPTDWPVDAWEGVIERQRQYNAELEAEAFPPEGWSPEAWEAVVSRAVSVGKNVTIDPPELLPIIDMTEWDGEPPARRSAWGDWLPLHQTTMLTGLGGIGKSLLEQMLLTCIALGRPFLGMPTEAMNCLYATCEDDAPELWRRQKAICAALGVNPTDLIGKLVLVSLTGETDTALMTDDGGKLHATDRWQQLRATCIAKDIRVYAFDNATDALAADHNDVHPVAAFVNMLTGLAIEIDGLAMIIHHPNKGGDDWLGSVAWHNKVRSRLLIEADDEDGDSDARTIKNPKANYAASGGKIRFRWWHGAFVCDDEIPEDQRAEMDALIRDNGANKMFLRCLDICTENRRNVSHHNGSNYAPKIFAGMPEAKGIKPRELAGAMERLLHLGEIALDQELWRGPNRLPKMGIARTNPPH